MNMLFGTHFNVMVGKTGRRQTTQGVWFALSPHPEDAHVLSTNTPTSISKIETHKKSALLVIDVEGTDSRERGEDHGQFERKTSLLTLAISDILVVNMWANDVGRHDGANYSLLKIIFELNLQLFQTSAPSTRSEKTLLLFCFRDHYDNDN